LNNSDGKNSYDDVSLSNHVSVPKIISGLAPPSDKGTSLQQLELSLSRINHASNTNIILGGDFNLGHIDWSIPQVIPGKPETELNIKLLDIIDEYNLHQLANVPTRKE
jgi:hypothetical protein